MKLAIQMAVSRIAGPSRRCMSSFKRLRGMAVWYQWPGEASFLGAPGVFSNQAVVACRHHRSHLQDPPDVSANLTVRDDGVDARRRQMVHQRQTGQRPHRLSCAFIGSGSWGPGRQRKRKRG